MLIIRLAQDRTRLHYSIQFMRKFQGKFHSIANYPNVEDLTQIRLNDLKLFISLRTKSLGII